MSGVSSPFPPSLIKDLFQSRPLDGGTMQHEKGAFIGVYRIAAPPTKEERNQQED